MLVRSTVRIYLAVYAIFPASSYAVNSTTYTPLRDWGMTVSQSSPLNSIENNILTLDFSLKPDYHSISP